MNSTTGANNATTGLGKPRSFDRSAKQTISDTSITPLYSQELMVEVAAGVGCVSQDSNTSHLLDQQAGQVDTHVGLKTIAAHCVFTSTPLCSHGCGTE